MLGWHPKSSTELYCLFLSLLRPAWAKTCRTFCQLHTSRRLQLPYQALVLLSRSLQQDASDRLLVLSGLSAVALVDQGAAWVRVLAGQCRSGKPPVDLAESFMVLAGVMSSVGAAVVLLTRSAVEAVMSTCCLLRREAFDDCPAVGWEALVRADLLGLSLVAPEALRECLTAFPVPPVCSG